MSESAPNAPSADQAARDRAAAVLAEWESSRPAQVFQKNEPLVEGRVLSLERDVLAIGLVYRIVGWPGCAIGLLGVALFEINYGLSSSDRAASIYLVLCSAVCIWIGRGLKRLQNAPRLVGLTVGFVARVGILINAVESGQAARFVYCLIPLAYLAVLAAAGALTTPLYREVRSLSPHVKVSPYGSAYFIFAVIALFFAFLNAGSVLHGNNR